MSDATKYTPYQQKMLEVWQQHGYAEFVLKDPKAAINTMGPNPYIFAVPLGQLLFGREEVYSFYAKDFLPNIPADFDMTPLRRVVGEDHIVDEFIVHFTHTVEMPWQIPNIPPTGRKVELIMTVMVGFEGEKMAYEHLMWDHASLLTQIGILNHPAAAIGNSSVSTMLKLTPGVKRVFSA